MYLDNILIFLDTKKEHVRYVKKVLACLYKAKLYFNPAKYKFYMQKTKYLGFIILPKGV